MAYGRKPYRRTGARRRPYRRRRMPAAIRPKKTVKRVVRKNYLVNRKQNRIIRALWNRQYGPIQKNLQRSVSNLGVAASLPISAGTPLLWDAADVSCYRINTAVPPTSSTNCRIWTVNNAGTALDQAGYWTTANFQNNNYWRYCNQDILEGGTWKPIEISYTIDFQVFCDPEVAPPFIYLHLFTQKRTIPRNNNPAPGTNILDFTMPWGLTHLRNMASGDLNRFNTEYFKIYKVRKLATLRNVAAASNLGASQHYYVSFKLRPKKVRSQLQLMPAIPGTVDGEDGQTSLGSQGAYQVDFRTPFWCMLSSSARNQAANEITTCNIMRKCVWRDAIGGVRVTG